MKNFPKTSAFGKFMEKVYNKKGSPQESPFYFLK